MDFSEIKPISLKADSDIGVLVSHGYSSTPLSMQYYCKALNEAGFHVECPILAGHADNWQKMDRYKWTDWLNDLENALSILEKRAKTIFVSGLSMGGALVLLLSQKYQDRFKGVIVINNSGLYDDIRLKMISFLKYFIKTGDGVCSDIKNPDEIEIGYAKLMTKSVEQFIILNNTMIKGLPLVKIPALIFKSLEDHVVPVRSSKAVYDKISSIDKEIIYLTNSYHVATQDFDKDIIFEKAIDFIKKRL